MDRAGAIRAFNHAVVETLRSSATAPVNVSHVFYYSYDSGGPSPKCEHVKYSWPTSLPPGFCIDGMIDPSTGDLLPASPWRSPARPARRRPGPDRLVHARHEGHAGMSASGAKHGQGNRRDQGHRSKTGAPALQHGPIPTVSWPAILDRCRIWRHGYDLSKETGLRSGTLYPLLMRLSEQGLLESRWQDAERPGLPPRHVYRLTARGLALAHEQEKEVTLSDRAGATA